MNCLFAEGYRCTPAGIDSGGAGVIKFNEASNGSPFLNQLRYPLIQRQAGCFGRDHRRVVRAGVKTQHELSRMRLEWINPFFRAHLQKHLQRSLAFLLQSGNIFGVKIRTAVQSDKLATSVRFGVSAPCYYFQPNRKLSRN